MALPVTIANVGAAGKSLGPYKGRNGAIYVVGQDRSDSGAIVVAKATDPTVSFVQQDSVNAPDVGTVIIGDVTSFREGDKIHIAFHREGTTSDNTWYARFDMESDTWDTITGSAEFTLVETMADSGFSHKCSIVVRSNGDIVVMHPREYKNMGESREGVGFRVSTDGGATWGSSTILDSNDTQRSFDATMVLGAGGRIHCFWKDALAPEFLERTIRANDTLETTQVIETNISLSSFSQGVTFNDGTNDEVWFPYWNNTNNTLSVLHATSEDTPTFTKDTDVSDGGTFHAHLIVDYQTLWAVYRNEVNDIATNKNENGAGWDTNETDQLIGTFGLITGAGVYDRGGPKIGILYAVGSVMNYHEFNVSEVLTTLEAAEFPAQNYRLGPFRT